MADGIKDAEKGNFSYDVGIYRIISFDDGSATVKGLDGEREHFVAETEAVKWANAMMLKGIADGSVARKVAEIAAAK